MAPFVDDDPLSFLVKKDLFKRQSYSTSTWTRNVIIGVIIVFLFLLIFTASFARRRSRRIALINAAAQEARLRQSEQTNGTYPPGQYNMDQSYQAAAPNVYHQWSAPAPPYAPPLWRPPPTQHHTNDLPWSSPQTPISQPPLVHQTPSPWQRPSGPPPTTWQPPSGPPPSGDVPSSQHASNAWQPPSGPPPSSSVPTQQPPSVWRQLSSHASPLDQPPSSPAPLISLSDPQAQAQSQVQTNPYLQAHKPSTSSEKKGPQQRGGQSPPSDSSSTAQLSVAGPPEPRIETPSSQPQSSTNPFKALNTPEQAVRPGTAEHPPPYQA